MVEVADPWLELVGMYCHCLVRVGSASFRYSAQLLSADKEHLLFKSVDGSVKMFHRDALLEVDAKPYRVPRDQQRLKSWGFSHD